MKLKTWEIHREYDYTDEESRKLAKKAIQNSKPLLEALIDDEPRKIPEIRIHYIERSFPCKLCELEGVDITLPSNVVKHLEHMSLGFFARRKRRC